MPQIAKGLIGMLGYALNNSWSFRMMDELNKVFHWDIVLFEVDKVRDILGPLVGEKHTKYKKLIHLSDVIKGYENIEMLIVEESYLWFKNDLKIPVIYYHTEIQMPYTVKYPTVVLYKNPEMNDFLHSFEPFGWSKILWKAISYPCAFPNFYMPDHPKDIQCSFVGPPTDMFDRKRDYLWRLFQQDHRIIVEYIQRKHLTTFYHDLGDEHHVARYNETLARSKHMICTSFNGVWIGRTMIECLASKCIPIIWVENDQAEHCLRNSLGYIPFPEEECNCYFFRKPYELDSIVFREYDNNMAERGYNLFLENHTFMHRAFELDQLIMKACRRINTYPPLSYKKVADPRKYHILSKKRQKA